MIDLVSVGKPTVGVRQCGSRVPGQPYAGVQIDFLNGLSQAITGKGIGQAGGKQAQADGKHDHVEHGSIPIGLSN